MHIYRQIYFAARDYRAANPHLRPQQALVKVLQDQFHDLYSELYDFDAMQYWGSTEDYGRLWSEIARVTGWGEHAKISVSPLG